MVWRIECDRMVTRRQYLHHIYDEAGKLRFSSKFIVKCFDFLVEHDIRTVSVHDGKQAFTVEIEPRPW